MKSVFTAPLALCISLACVQTLHAAPQNTLHTLKQNGFVYCADGMISSFNPQMVSSGIVVDTLAAQLYNGLLSVDPVKKQFKSELATHWDVLDNGKRYRFHLRKGTSFQNTLAFTPTRTMNADDVIFSFQRVFNKDHPFHDINGGEYPYFDSLQFGDTVKEIIKVDDYTVDFVLNSRNMAFLWHLATRFAPVLSAEYAQQLTKSGQQSYIDHRPVGTGPYKVDEYHTGQFIRLVRHDDYWQGQPKMQQVIVDLGTGGTGRLSKLLTGECDILAYPAASQLSVLNNDQRFALSKRPGMNIAYLAFNTKKAPLNRPEVRRALSLAINNDRLMQSIYYGTARTASSILPHVSWAHDPNSKITSYNPNLAKKMLAKAGLKDLTLRLWVNDSPQPYNPSPIKTAQLLQADLAQVGVKVNIIPVEGRFQDRYKSDRNHDLILTGWNSDNRDPDSVFRPLLSCAAANVSKTNYAHWCNPVFDQLITSALASNDRHRRIIKYTAAQQILAEELPILPIATSSRLEAYRKGIKGAEWQGFGSPSFNTISRVTPEDTK